jgi:hypothetical protein
MEHNFHHQFEAAKKVTLAVSERESMRTFVLQSGRLSRGWQHWILSVTTVASVLCGLLLLSRVQNPTLEKENVSTKPDGEIVEEQKEKVLKRQHAPQEGSPPPSYPPAATFSTQQAIPTFELMKNAVGSDHDAVPAPCDPTCQGAPNSLRSTGSGAVQTQ